MVNPSEMSSGQEGNFDQLLRDLNEALLLSSIRQHELTEIAEQHEAECHALFIAAPVGIFVCDHNAIIQQYNPQAVKLWGRRPVCGVDRFCGSKKMWLPNGTQLRPSQSPIVEVLRTGIRIDDVELSLERDNGPRLSVLMNLAPLKDEQGTITGAIVSFIDLSERKRLEATVGESELRHRRLFETAQDGLLILDADHQMIIHSNTAMTHLLGHTREYLIGKHLWQICLPDDRTECQAIVGELLKVGCARYEHLPLRSQRGDKVDVEVVANVFEQGGRRLIQCNIRDISKRRRRERLMHEQAEALIDSHRIKDEFLAMLSHELRKPLAPISNAVHLMNVQKVEDEVHQQALDIIQRQVKQLTRLVDDVTEVSRITTGRMHLRTSRITVKEIVKSAINKTQSLIDERSQELSLSLPEKPIWLKADAARLVQVFVNLLMNAAQYTDEGGHIAVEVKLAGTECVVRIRDNGIGIAPELLPRIFQLFTQVDRSLERTQGGLGIGLTLVQRLVILHGGRVEVQSAVGEGSEFAVYLPTVADPNTSQLLEALAPQDAETALRLLVVDDNEDSARSLGLLLRAKGHAVRTAFDGPEALDAALNYQPHAIFLDIALPGLSGYEVAKRLRQRTAFRNVTLIALTGYGKESDRQLSEAAGFDHHLIKPVDLVKVEQILCTIFE